MRGYQYEKHQSTTWPVVLVSAAFQAYVTDHNYTLMMYSAAHIARENEAALGESDHSMYLFRPHLCLGLCA